MAGGGTISPKKLGTEEKKSCSESKETVDTIEAVSIPKVSDSEGKKLEGEEAEVLEPEGNKVASDDAPLSIVSPVLTQLPEPQDDEKVGNGTNDAVPENTGEKKSDDMITTYRKDADVVQKNDDEKKASTDSTIGVSSSNSSSSSTSTTKKSKKNRSSTTRSSIIESGTLMSMPSASPGTSISTIIPAPRMSTCSIGQSDNRTDDVMKLLDSFNSKVMLETNDSLVSSSCVGSSSSKSTTAADDIVKVTTAGTITEENVGKLVDVIVDSQAQSNVLQQNSDDAAVTKVDDKKEDISSSNEVPVTEEKTAENTAPEKTEKTESAAAAAAVTAVTGNETAESSSSSKETTNADASNEKTVTITTPNGTTYVVKDERDEASTAAAEAGAMARNDIPATDANAADPSIPNATNASTALDSQNPYSNYYAGTFDSHGNPTDAASQLYATQHAQMLAAAAALGGGAEAAHGTHGAHSTQPHPHHYDPNALGIYDPHMGVYAHHHHDYSNAMMFDPYTGYAYDPSHQYMGDYHTMLNQMGTIAGVVDPHAGIDPVTGLPVVSAAPVPSVTTAENGEMAAGESVAAGAGGAAAGAGGTTAAAAAKDGTSAADGASASDGKVDGENGTEEKSTKEGEATTVGSGAEITVDSNSSGAAAGTSQVTAKVTELPPPQIESELSLKEKMMQSQAEAQKRRQNETFGSEVHGVMSGQLQQHHMHDMLMPPGMNNAEIHSGSLLTHGMNLNHQHQHHYGNSLPGVPTMHHPGIGGIPHPGVAAHHPPMPPMPSMPQMPGQMSHMQTGHLQHEVGRLQTTPEKQIDHIRKKNAEYSTEIHFQKCYNVMAEIWDTCGENLPKSGGFKFLDFGCAPGGFSCYLLENQNCLGGIVLLCGFWWFLLVV